MSSETNPITRQFLNDVRRGDTHRPRPLTLPSERPTVSAKNLRLEQRREAFERSEPKSPRRLEDR